jgi:hypothetical protein
MSARNEREAHTMIQHSGFHRIHEGQAFYGPYRRRVRLERWGWLVAGALSVAAWVLLWVGIGAVRAWLAS